MIEENLENGKYQMIDTERNEVLCTIESLGNNIYKAINKHTQITAEIIPLDEYKTSLKCIENKSADKNGVFKRSKKLAEHNTNWLYYMLQEKGFIRKAVPPKGNWLNDENQFEYEPECN
jgi:hypothetical protein